MNIHTVLNTALTAVLPNTWSTELPPKPAWPALVFNVSTEPEKGWVLGGGYDMNSVEVMIYARTRAEITALQDQVLAAMENLAGYMGDEEHGDSAYESDPKLYAYSMNYVVRTQKTS